LAALRRLGRWRFGLTGVTLRVEPHIHAVVERQARWGESVPIREPLALTVGDALGALEADARDGVEALAHGGIGRARIVARSRVDEETAGALGPDVRDSPDRLRVAPGRWV
jgi:hypothetical protein